MPTLFSKTLSQDQWKEIGLTLAQYADEVDQEGRFPEESIQLLKEYNLLSAYIPSHLNGQGMNLNELVSIGKFLGEHCAATGMIWAMHQTQIACLVHHGLESKELSEALKKIADNEWLIASITSEVGTGGDIGRSIAGLEIQDDFGYLMKEGSVVSYGNHAQAFLATSKRSKEDSGTNQSLVFLMRENMILKQTSDWDTLGMRGTCSPGFSIEAKFPLSHVIKLPYKDISSQTMVPFSHILWSAVWNGIARSAFSKARKLSKLRAKNSLKNGDPHFEDLKLVSIHHTLTLLENNLEISTQKYHELSKNNHLNVEGLDSLEFSLHINNLKVISSELAVKVVQESLLLCGFPGFQNNNEFSVGRNLRDILSSIVMIHNHRLDKTSSSLLLLQRY